MPNIFIAKHSSFTKYSLNQIKIFKLFFSNQVEENIYVIWVHHHHHHHITLVARISLTLSRHSSLLFIALGRSSEQHPVSSHSC